jgi:putative transposase
MPRKRLPTAPDPAQEPVPAEILDQFVQPGALTAQDVEAAMRRFKKALIERALGAELSHHLGYRPEERSPRRAPIPVIERALRRCSPTGRWRIEVPRDLEGSFEPLLVPKHERRFTGVRRQDRGVDGRGQRRHRRGISDPLH